MAFSYYLLEEELFVGTYYNNGRGVCLLNLTVVFLLYFFVGRSQQQHDHVRDLAGIV